MFKVEQKDRIKIVDPDLVRTRIKEFTDNKASAATIAQFHKLDEFLSSKAEGKPPKALFNRIYKFIDEFMAECVYPYASCQASCSYCCKIPVEISAIEAGYIAQQTGADLIKQPFDKSKLGYCPFHDPNTAKCQIYSIRPIECRSFASLDGTAGCEDPNLKHMIFNARQSEMLKHMKYWANFQSQSIANQNKVPIKADIRYWFGQ